MVVTGAIEVTGAAAMDAGMRHAMADAGAFRTLARKRVFRLRSEMRFL
jgi:hypothetical protein